MASEARAATRYRVLAPMGPTSSWSYLVAHGCTTSRWGQTRFGYPRATLAKLGLQVSGGGNVNGSLRELRARAYTLARTWRERHICRREPLRSRGRLLT